VYMAVGRVWQGHAIKCHIMLLQGSKHPWPNCGCMTRIVMVIRRWISWGMANMLAIHSDKCMWAMTRGLFSRVVGVCRITMWTVTRGLFLSIAKVCRMRMCHRSPMMVRLGRNSHIRVTRIWLLRDSEDLSGIITIRWTTWLWLRMPGWALHGARCDMMFRFYVHVPYIFGRRSLCGREFRKWRWKTRLSSEVARGRITKMTRLQSDIYIRYVIPGKVLQLP